MGRLDEKDANLRNDHIDEHIERIKRIRKCMDQSGDNRKLIGAIAGWVVPDEVLNYAHEHGLYVITQNGETVSIADVPPGFSAGVW